MKVLRLSPAEARERMTEAMSVYAEAMGYPPEAGQHRAGFAIAHTRRPAFRAVAASDPVASSAAATIAASARHDAKLRDADTKPK